MSYEVKGRLAFIGSTVQVTETFRKKEFAIELKEIVGDKEYTNYVKLQLTQNKTELLNGFAIGDSIKCHFNLRGSKSIKNGTTNYFTNIECWKVEGEQGQGQPSGRSYQQQPAPENITKPVDDLPF